MTAGAPVLPAFAGRRPGEHTETDAPPATIAARIWRVATFAALALYGVIRWETLMSHAPTWRLLGLALIAVVLAGAVPLVRDIDRRLAVALAIVLAIVALPVAGVPWHWWIHVRIAVTAGRIDQGLTALPAVLVPFLGGDPAVRLVIVLGAAVLLIDGAAVLAFAPRQIGDGRRAAAALPLLALAVVPSTLVRPQQPYLQGLILFGLLTAFVWGERLQRDRRATALAAALLAGLVGLALGPGLDGHRPWLDYRSLTASSPAAHADVFNWEQTYGPLRWPQSGHQVLDVSARFGDYWKAEDLDTFDGREWTLGNVVGSTDALPSPSAASVRRWTQRVTVTITGMKTQDVIVAGSATAPSTGAGQVVAGTDPGTWLAERTLGPGTTYSFQSYSPQPAAAQLRTAGTGYPQAATLAFRTLLIPRATPRGFGATAVEFPLFHHRWPGGSSSRSFVGGSPYGRAFALAHRLAASARTPYDFVLAVQRYLGTHGYRYDQNTPLSRYPLESFLFSTKLGYCQQFSGSMALLLRMGGIPARVATGFTSGTFANESHRWEVTDTDAHAWVEAWFPGYGWVRFDPTPASAPARGGTGGQLLLHQSGDQPTPITPSAIQHSTGLPAAGGGVARQHRSTDGSWPWPLLVVLGLLALALVLGLGWIVRALLAPAPSAEQRLAELRRAMSRTGHRLSGDATLASLERRFADDAAACAYLRALRLQRYGVGHDAGGPTGAQRRALRRRLGHGLGMLGRLRALWALPPRLRSGAAGPWPGSS